MLEDVCESCGRPTGCGHDAKCLPEPMSHDEQLNLMWRVINRGSKTFDAHIVGDTIEINPDGYRYVITIHKAR